MKTKIAVGLVMLLIPAFFLAARHINPHNRPTDFRDALNSREGAVGELQRAAPGGLDLNPEMPSPGPVAAQTPESGGAAEEGVHRYYSKHESDLSHSWDSRLAKALGVNYPCYVEVKQLSGRSDGTGQLLWKRTYDDGSRREAVVVKRFGGTSHANQWFMKMVSLGSLNYEHSARKLYDNGLAMIKKFRAVGLNTLEVVLTEPDKLIMVTKFVKGEDIDAVFRAALKDDAGALRSVEKISAALGAAHRNGFAVGDFNTGNGMIINGEFSFIDLDRASVGGGKGWDIVLPFYHAILQKPAPAKSEDWAVIARTFLKGYLAGGGDPATIKEALGKRYSTFLGPIIAVRGRSHIHAVRREMKLAAGADMTRESEDVLEAIP